LRLLGVRRWRRRGRPRGFFGASEKVAEETGGVAGLLLSLTELIELGACVSELLLCLIEGVLLYEDSLGEDVERVGVAAERLAEHVFGVGVFFGKLGLVDALNQALK
jgi:hypothetical protein